MAIDTREKRMSMMNFGDGNNWHTLFEADSVIDQDDRLHLLDLYAGFGSIEAAGEGALSALTGLSGLTPLVGEN